MKWVSLRNSHISMYKRSLKFLTGHVLDRFTITWPCCQPVFINSSLLIIVTDFIRYVVNVTVQRLWIKKVFCFFLRLFLLERLSLNKKVLKYSFVFIILCSGKIQNYTYLEKALTYTKKELSFPLYLPSRPLYECCDRIK